MMSPIERQNPFAAGTVGIQPAASVQFAGIRGAKNAPDSAELQAALPDWAKKVTPPPVTYRDLEKAIMDAAQVLTGIESQVSGAASQPAGGKKEIRKTVVNMTDKAHATLFELNKTVGHGAEVIIGRLHPAMERGPHLHEVGTS